LTAKPFRRCGVQQQRVSACAQKGAGLRQKGRKQVCVGINGNRQRFPEGARNLSLQRCDEFRRFITVQLQDGGLKGMGEVNQFVQRFAPCDQNGRDGHEDEQGTGLLARKAAGRGGDFHDDAAKICPRLAGYQHIIGTGEPANFDLHGHGDELAP
jgi:hypothetical protein